MSLIIQISEGVKYTWLKILPMFCLSVCTICVFININHVQKWVGGAGGSRGGGEGGKLLQKLYRQLPSGTPLFLRLCR